MNRRERLEKTIAGEMTDRVPVALWRHWPGDDQRPVDLARSILDFQYRWDFDFIKVTPASSYCIADYGVEDRWLGSLEGTREYSKRAVVDPEDWTRLPTLDPTAGRLGEQLETLRLVKAGLSEDVPIIHTIFNPLAQVKNIAGPENLIGYLRQSPNQLKAGLETLTNNTLHYLEAVKDTGVVAGIFYAVQHASYSIMSEAEYEEFGKPYDRRILEALPEDWWFNLLHLHGDAPMFDLIAEYPVQALNWHDRETSPSLAEGKAKFSGAVCGGLGRWDAVHNGTPEEVRLQAADAILLTEGRRFILSTGCVLMATSPQSNIRAIRQAVETG